MRSAFLSVVCLLTTQFVFAQTNIILATSKTGQSGMRSAFSTAQHMAVQDDENYFSRFNVGLGIGVDYGGIAGARITFLPAKPVFLFAALGYNLQTAGYNVGGGVRLAPNSNFCPYLIGMYGYNGVIVIKNDKTNSKTYYGPTAGVGGEIHSRTSDNYLNVELLVPFRNKSFDDDMDYLESIGVEFNNKALPVAFSFGYHFLF